MSPKVLFIDIECSPNVAHVWGLWNNNVSLAQLQESQEVISFAAKWQGKKKVHFYSVFHHSKEEMVDAAHTLLDEANVVVTYNGIKYDLPHLNREFIEAGLTPPSPYTQVDLLRTVKRQFRFPSNKLDYVCQALNLGAKEEHSGHELWVQCMAGSASAWATMKRYNVHDTKLTERLYDKLLPWIHPHPNLNLYGGAGCPQCGSSDLRREGYARTGLGLYQRYQCRDCGKWSRDKHKLGGSDVRGIS